MIVTSQQLKEKYSNLSDIKGKIAREIKKGELFPLVKGIYETDPNVMASRLAQFIYGPSYISFDYVLYNQGLIPEAIYNTITCATFNKKKIKTYKNKFGTFIYRDVPKEVFSLGVVAFREGDYSYQIATLEKALCDKLYIISPVKNLEELEQLLFEDLRIDEVIFDELDKCKLIELCDLYSSKTLHIFKNYLEDNNEK